MTRTAPEPLTIRSSRLAIELARPGSAIQKGSRFDLTGQAVQVVLDGRHTFCAPEDFDENRGSGGLGLCNEFWDYSNTLFHSAGCGERFPKMGVGLLLRETGDEYHFMTHYPKQAYPIDMAATDDTATFTVHPAECQGYAGRLEKKLSVINESLLIEYSFENVGTKPIDVMEYNHNFVCIDGHPVGPDYRLRLPYPVEMAETPGVLSVRGKEITWKGIPDTAFYCQPRVLDRNQPYMWELTHMPSGVGMREYDDFPIDHAALWGKSHVVSVEVFIRLRLAPNESLKWRRKYEFFVE